MCGGCHAEDAPVAKDRNIEQHDILEHYEQSIHGEGILSKGLTAQQAARKLGATEIMVYGKSLVMLLVEKLKN